MSKQEYRDWGLFIWSCGFGAVAMTVLAVLEFTKYKGERDVGI